MRQKPTPGWIYVLEPGITVDDKPVVKIGYTTQPVERRVQQLATGSVGRFRIAYREWVNDAPAVEASVHRALRAARVHREFFAVPVADAVKEIQRVAPTITMSAADKNWAAAMNVYREKIGAAAAERSVARTTKYIVLAATAVWVGTFGYATFKGTTVALWGVIPGTLIFAFTLQNALEKRLRAQWVDTPFGAALAEERSRLNRLYVSWSGRWAARQEVSSGVSSSP